MSEGCPIRLSDRARAQLDALRPPTLSGLPVRVVPGLPEDTILLATRAHADAVAEVLARGYELGEMTISGAERDADTWTVTMTQEIRRRRG